MLTLAIYCKTMLSSQLGLELTVNKFDLYHVLFRFSEPYFYKNTNAVSYILGILKSLPVFNFIGATISYFDKRMQTFTLKLCTKCAQFSLACYLMCYRGPKRSKKHFSRYLYCGICVTFSSFY